MHANPLNDYDILKSLRKEKALGHFTAQLRGASNSNCFEEMQPIRATNRGRGAQMVFHR